MARKRVHEIAKAQGLTSKEVLAALQAAGVEAKAAASSVEEDVALKALEAADDGDGAGAAQRAGSAGGGARRRAPRSRGGARSRRPRPAEKPVRPVRPAGDGARRRKPGRRSAAGW